MVLFLHKPQIRCRFLYLAAMIHYWVFVLSTLRSILKEPLWIKGPQTLQNNRHHLAELLTLDTTAIVRSINVILVSCVRQRIRSRVPTNFPDDRHVSRDILQQQF
jgi:hypothetical protein